MYNGSSTSVKAERGVSAEYYSTVDLHQGSVFSPFLFVVVLGVLSESVRKEK